MEQKEGGIRIERDEFGHSEILDEQQAPAAGRQVGGISDADMDQAGGSSGTGGYGNAENQQHHQGTGTRSPSGNAPDAGGEQRGERFDEEQGGGRS